MGIRQCLQNNRYGTHNIKAPTKDDLDDYGLKTTHLRKPVAHIFDRLIYQMRNPPVKDQYYKHYIYTVEKYMDELAMATKQSQWQSIGQLVNIHTAGKLTYMLDHPARFKEFHNFRYVWLYNILCAMRTYVINRAYFRGDIQHNNTTSQWSAGFVPWPKPMGSKAMGLLADNLYDIIQPRCDLIISRSNKHQK